MHRMEEPLLVGCQNKHILLWNVILSAGPCPILAFPHREGFWAMSVLWVQTVQTNPTRWAESKACFVDSHFSYPAKTSTGHHGSQEWLESKHTFSETGSRKSARLGLRMNAHRLRFSRQKLLAAGWEGPLFQWSSGLWQLQDWALSQQLRELTPTFPAWPLRKPRLRKQKWTVWVYEAGKTQGWTQGCVTKTPGSIVSASLLNLAIYQLKVRPKAGEG